MLVAASPAAGSTVQAVAAPESHTGGVLIQIEGVDLPGLGCAPSPDSPGGYFNVHVAVQRRNRRAELLGLTPGNATSATWAIDCVPVRTASGFDLKGQHIQGPPGARFIYLSWGTVDDAKNFELFRRAKLWLDCIPSEVVASAVDQGLLVGRLGLTDHKGNPLCAAVPPPLIEWSAGSGQITPGQPTVSDILG
ncbi:MAG: DUF5990 family protein [Pseudonocardiaceae bacterium]